MKLMPYADKISIRAKLIIFAVMTLIAVAVPSYYLQHQNSASVQLSELSIQGTPIAQQTVLLRKVIAVHRGTSARWLGGDESARSAVLSAADNVDTAFRNLLNVLENNPHADTARLLIQQHYTTWVTLKDNAINKVGQPTAIFNRHSQLIDDIGEVAAVVMRNFKLIYAPSDSAYHLVRANFDALPMLTDTLGKIRGMGAGVLTRQTLEPSTRARLEGLQNNARAVNQEFLRNLRYAAETSREPALQALINDATTFNSALTQSLSLLELQILTADALDYPSGQFFNAFTEEIDLLYSKQATYVTLLEDLLISYNREVSQQQTVKWVTIVILLLLASGIFVLVNLSITRGINHVTKALSKLAVNDYSVRFKYRRDDEIGIIQESVETLTNELKAYSKQSLEAIRVRQALDNSSSCFMLADNDRNIIYLNQAVRDLFSEAEHDLRKDLPNFRAHDLLGSNIDDFHKDPSHQAHILSHLDSQYVTQIAVGGRHYRLIASPIKSENGERLGACVEWVDRTKEVLAEREIGELVSGAVAGNFSVRASTDGKTGFYLALAENLNQLMDVTEQGLQQITVVLQSIAKQDLTTRIESDFDGTFGEMKEYCNTTASNLAEVIAEIREAAETITSASGEIAKGNADLSTRTEQQAANLEETASSMEEMTSTVQLNANNAKQANNLASNAAQVAGEGGKLIEKVVATMTEIHASASKIADIIGVIDGIAFQTNILALNAAVEAARAGEQGRGFAVVAAEVRTLAQRSANAAKDIKALISDSVSKVESGNVLVNQSGETMQHIVDAVTNVNDIMAEIASASVQQASGIEAINEAIAQMDDMTQQNAALVEEAAAAAESMNSQAEHLVSRVQSFVIADAYTRSFEAPKALGSFTPEKRLYKSNRALPKTVDDDEWESF
ncbi:methyl-accepting chemotaxis protein [Alteromonas sp. ASW11-36]|uniref:Methyl-accepting chemotaxis protein n=1 Tax=Alteromonas arenosi TaxID=3055817 RepID=A0ABT7T312_9ALTE|nr:methyl-accepting chemotaxis protein [Alteromonas sp. ASW11-36]MDM7862187.1 methyl-accepting chemotaxis protein [Alteromonas sp. ASW11-36]